MNDAKAPVQKLDKSLSNKTSYSRFKLVETDEAILFYTVIDV
jgi:hypothetical protein